MRRLGLWLSVALSAGVTAQTPPSTPTVAVVAGPAGQPSQPLLGPQNLVYQGAFRCPSSALGPPPATCAYGGQALAFNPSTSGLFFSGHDTANPLFAAELIIPPTLGLVPITTPQGSSLINTLPRAAIRQPFADPLDGKAPLFGASAQNSYKLGGFLPWNQKLITTAYLFYDANGVQQLTHLSSGQTLANQTDSSGPFNLGTVRPFGPGFVSGYMGVIPQAWRALLGGPAFTGYCCLSIISRTSLGPSLTIFDPDGLGLTIPLPVTTLLGYPLRSTLMPPGYVEPLGNCSSTGTLFNCAVVMAGVVFPDNTRSVLFFGRLGSGPACYGAGVAANPGINECLDPSEQAKGYHAYPYTYFVWAYDVLDLIAVKQGQKKPWDVLPYRTWSFDLPFAFPAKVLRGVAYDQTSSRIYLTQADGDAYGVPLVHVLNVVP